MLRQIRRSNKPTKNIRYDYLLFFPETQRVRVKIKINLNPKTCLCFRTIKNERKKDAVS
jgi:Tfp pilus assembly ATPase PilU